MEAMILLAALGGAAIWLLHKGITAAALSAARKRHAARVQAAWVLRRAAANQKRKKRLSHLNALARNLQLSLLGVRTAPDFRRAASWAALASAVPLPFRQRQYRRFRPLLVEHFRARLEAGDQAEPLAQSLSTLVQALGVAAFEASYIRQEAERTLAARRQPSAPAPYAQQIAQAQAEHEQRLAALRGAQVTGDVREQLLEAEETRFREALQLLSAADAPATHPTDDGRFP